MAACTYAWRITDQGLNSQIAAGFTSFDEPLAEWDVAPVIVDRFRETHPDAGTVTIDVWLKEDWLPAGHLVPWQSDRDPHGTDPVPSDAAAYSYAPPVDEDPDDRARGDALAAALKGHDEALGHVAAETAKNAVAALGDRDDY